MNNRKKYLAVLAAAAIVTTTVTVQASDFKDVSSTYEPAVDYLVVNEIAVGKSSLYFGTTHDITRGDAAVMIAKALKLDTTSAPNSPFTDLNSRIKGAVNALYYAEIVAGRTPTTYDPDAPITRVEVARMLSIALGLEEGPETSHFEDVNKVWAPYVNALVREGITVGKTDTTFAPYQNITRGEFALFIFRGKEFLEEPTPTPVTIHDLDGTVEEPVEFTESLNLDIEDAGGIDNVNVTGDLTLHGTVAGESFELVNITINGNLDLSGIDGEVNLTNVNVTGDIIF